MLKLNQQDQGAGSEVRADPGEPDGFKAGPVRINNKRWHLGSLTGPDAHPVVDRSRLARVQCVRAATSRRRQEVTVAVIQSKSATIKHSYKCQIVSPRPSRSAPRSRGGSRRSSSRRARRSSGAICCSRWDRPRARKSRRPKTGTVSSPSRHLATGQSATSPLCGPVFARARAWPPCQTTAQ